MENTIYTCLWFDNKAKEAANYYCSIFKNSKIVSQNDLVVVFLLKGKKFLALNGGTTYKFSPATSFVVACKNQEEIDYYWENLGKNGTHKMCGWLEDKFGVSWQIVPEILSEWMNDAEKAPKVTQAFLKMQKFDIQKLKDALT